MKLQSFFLFSSRNLGEMIQIDSHFWDGWLNHQLVNSFDGGKKIRTPSRNGGRIKQRNEIDEIFGGGPSLWTWRMLCYPPFLQFTQVNWLPSLETNSIKSTYKNRFGASLKDFLPQNINTQKKSMKAYRHPNTSWGSVFHRYVLGGPNSFSVSVFGCLAKPCSWGSPAVGDLGYQR